MTRLAGALLIAACTLVPAASSVGPWQRGSPLPLARTEVVAAVLGEEIAIVGGFLVNGSSTARSDLYSPGRNRWRRLPDLPLAVNHAMAGAYRGRLYVVGGYGQDGERLKQAHVFAAGRWQKLRPLPSPRAAGAAAVAGGRLYVFGGVGPTGLAESAFVLNLKTARWSSIPGPAPREHLGGAAADGVVYAVAGRTAGLDSNTRLVEAYDPVRRSWRPLPPVPGARGGTAATVSGRLLVSVGGEAPEGTIKEVYALNLKTRRWQMLPDLPTPRHGLGVVALRGRVYAIGGGPRPGLFVSAANEYLRLR